MHKDTTSIRFLGGAGTVTGSKYLIQASGIELLIDCGLFQGLKKLRLMNWQPIDYDVSKLSYVLLSHGHLDHCGFIPRLMNMGFKGKILGTAATLDVASLILLDSAAIQEEEAYRANKYGYSKHKPAMPLYTVKDAEKAISCFKAIDEGVWINLAHNSRVRFFYNSHILGSTYIELFAGNKTFIFSGDIGRENDLLLYPPKRPVSADYLFIESTYGDKMHPDMKDVRSQLKEIIKLTLKRKGIIVIPGFAVERVQGIILLLSDMIEKKEIPEVPVIMDSPMASDVLKLFKKHGQLSKLSSKEINRIAKHVRTVGNYNETINIAKDRQPKIIIAGSGMLSGGRVLEYLKTLIENDHNTVLLSGYQAEGTRGRALLEGATEIKIHGKFYAVKATVMQLNGLSAHADQSGLLDWLSEINNTPEKVFVVHGEENASKALKQKIKDRYKWKVMCPLQGTIVHLES